MSTILITGANRGIGLALTQECLRQGHDVIAAARTPENAHDLAALQEAGKPSRLEILKLDVTNRDQIQAAADRVTSRFDCLDVLINNAGVFPEESNERLDELDLSLLELALAVNVLGTAQMCQVFLPLLRTSRRPRILNISSGAASITTKEDHRRYCYGPSKTALNMFTRTLAFDLKPEGITVVALSPGWVRTAMGGENADLAPEESAAKIAETIDKLSMNQTGEFLDRHERIGGYAW